MRRLLLISLLTIVLALFITGCGIANQADTATNGTETQPIQTTTATPLTTTTASLTTTTPATSPTTNIPMTTATPTTTTQTTEAQTTAAGPATFSVSDMTIEPRIPSPGKSFTTSVTVTNTGGSQGSYDVILYIHKMDFQLPDNPAIMATTTYTESVIIAAGESIIVTFEPFISDDGVYTLTVDELVDYLEMGQCTY